MTMKISNELKIALFLAQDANDGSSLKQNPHISNN